MALLKFGERADLYAEFPDTDDYGNILPQDFTKLLSQMPLNIHRGATEAKNDAAASGWDTNLAALAYCSTDYENYLRGLMVLITPTEYWRIMGQPSVRKSLRLTNHIRLVLKLLYTVPPGVPALSSTIASYVESGGVTGKGLVSGSDIYTPA